MLWREHRRRVLGMADLIPWVALVDEGVMANSDGTLTLGWSWHGPDLESATDEELVSLSQQLNKAFSLLDERWLLHMDAIRGPRARYPEEQSAPTPPVLRFLDRRRAAGYTGEAHYGTRCYAALTYMPPEDSVARLRDLLVTRDPEARERNLGREHLAALHAKVRDVEGQLSRLLRFKRLDSPGLLRYLHACASGLDHPVKEPPMPCFLSGLLASQDFVGGRAPRLGRLELRPVSISGFPAETFPVILDRLNGLKVTYRWSTRFLPLSPQLAREAIKKRQAKWHKARQGMRALVAEMLSNRDKGDTPDERLTIDAEAEAMTDDAGAALASIGEVQFGYYSSVVLVFADERPGAEDGAQRVANELRAAGLTCIVEDNNAVEAFMGSWPGDRRHNVRHPMVSTRNLADLLPVSAPWTGPEVHPSPLYPKGSPVLSVVTAQSGAPFVFTPADGDVLHTLVVGATGAGKSTLLSWWAAQFAERYAHLDAQVVMFDKGLSFYGVTRAAGGAYYNPGQAGMPAAFAPLAGVADAGERLWAEGWLEELLMVQGETVGRVERGLLAEALKVVAGKGSATLSDFLLALPSPGLRGAVERYTARGTHGQLFDAERDGWDTGAKWQTVELGELQGVGVKEPVFRYLFHRIDQSLDGRPTLIVIDEAWDVLAHPLFAEKIRQWLKELRKRNAAVVIATQSIADIEASQYSDAILESCPSKVLLPTAEALTPKGQQQYARLGLNERQIRMLGEGTKKADYYLVSPAGRRAFRLDLTPEEIAFYGVSPMDAMALAEFEGDDWPAWWLRKKRLAAAAQAYDETTTLALAVSAFEKGV